MLPAALQIPAFRRLAGASTLSVLGSMMTFVVLPLVAWDATGSGAVFASVLAAGSLGILVAMPFGGVVADRFDRRRVMLAGDAVSVGMMLAFLLVVHQELWHALALVEFCHAFVGSFFVSAGPALRRDVLPDELRTQGNSIFVGGISAANLLGPIIGIGLYEGFGYDAVVLADVLTYVASFALLLGLRHELTHPRRRVRTDAGELRAEDGVEEQETERAAGVRGAVATTLRDLRLGFLTARRDAFLCLIMLASLTFAFGNGVLLVAIVPWIDESLGLPSSTWGALVAVMGGAGVVGAIVLARVGERVRSARLLRWSSVAAVAGTIGFVGTPPIAVVAIGCALFGFTNVANSVATQSIIQRRVPAVLQGRINSLLVCNSHASQLVGIAVAGLLVEQLGATWLMGGAAATLALGAATSFVAAGHAPEPPPVAGANVDDLDLVVSA